MQNEQHHLEQQIREILEENSRINSKLEILKSAASNNSDFNDGFCTRDRLTNETIKNFKRQFEYLKAVCYKLFHIKS